MINRWKNPIVSLLLIFIVVIIFSCVPKADYECYKTFKQSVWHKDSVAFFEFVNKDANNQFDIYWNVRNMGNYPYSNLWLFVSMQAPDGTLIKDTLELTLAEKNGRWLGKGIGDLYDQSFLYQQSIKFPVQGNYQFKIQQGMRNVQLTGIHDFGLSITKSK